MRAAAGLLLILFASQAAAAQSGPGERPALFQKLIDCREIATPAERLACFDRELAAVEAAETRKELVVLDQSQVRSTRRSLFGLAIPNLDIFGDSSDDAEREITSTITRAWIHSNGKWAFELADGANWSQIDSRDLVFEPEPGQPVRIRRAALGSYLANVDRQSAIRVRRIQ